MSRSGNCRRETTVSVFVLTMFILYVLYWARVFRSFFLPQITCMANGPTFKGSAAKSQDPRGGPPNVCQMRYTDFKESDFPRFTWYKGERKVVRSQRGTELLLQFYQSQFCHKPRCLESTLDLPSRQDGQGVGHRLIQEAHSLQMAMGFDRVFRVALGGWKYCDKVNCPAESTVCYFEPVHGCKNISSADALKEWILVKDFLITLVGKSQHIYVNGNYNFHDGARPCFESPPLVGFEQNRFYNSAIATYFMNQPQKWLLREVESKRRSMGLDKGYLAMHVRHGDKWKNVDLINFSDYMDIVIKNYPKYTTILLMTSDQQVIDDTARYPDYRFVWTDYPRFYGASSECHTKDPQKRTAFGCKDLHIPNLIKTGKLNGHKEMVNAMVNFYLAVDSIGLICTLSSNYPRSILRFRLGAYDNLMPVWSLQDWSYDVGIKKMPYDLKKHITFIPPIPDSLDLSKSSLANFLTGF